MKSKSINQITQFSPQQVYREGNIQQTTKYRLREALSSCKCNFDISFEYCRTCWNCKLLSKSRTSFYL